MKTKQRYLFPYGAGQKTKVSSSFIKKQLNQNAIKSEKWKRRTSDQVPKHEDSSCHHEEQLFALYRWS